MYAAGIYQYSNSRLPIFFKHALNHLFRDAEGDRVYSRWLCFGWVRLTWVLKRKIFDEFYGHCVTSSQKEIVEIAKRPKKKINYYFQNRGT